MTQTDRGRNVPPLVACANAREKEGLNMTTKEKIRIHIQIEQENRRKLKEWKEGRKSA